MECVRRSSHFLERFWWSSNCAQKTFFNATENFFWRDRMSRSIDGFLHDRKMKKDKK